jgi:hypothetical protein
MLSKNLFVSFSRSVTKEDPQNQITFFCVVKLQFATCHVHATPLFLLRGQGFRMSSTSVWTKRVSRATKELMGVVLLWSKKISLPCAIWCKEFSEYRVLEVANVVQQNEYNKNKHLTVKLELPYRVLQCRVGIPVIVKKTQKVTNVLKCCTRDAWKALRVFTGNKRKGRTKM